MAIKKYTNGSWVSASYRKYGTETDTITTLPATVIGDGMPISSYTIKGNMEQNGTPTPSSPIMPSECGEKTKNLAYGKIITASISSAGIIGRESGYDLAIARVEAGKVYTANTYVFAFYTDEPIIGSVSYDGTRNVKIVGQPSTFTAPITGYVAFRLDPEEQAMLNLGSTALPYEPYGYKLPITLGGTTTNIYLGEVQTTRRIKKLVLTGEEEYWSKNTSIINSNAYSVIVPNYYERRYVGLCSHYATVDNIIVEEGIYFGQGINFLTALSDEIDTIDKWKSYLAAQYAAGTPVTIWYILAEPETGIVNEPIRKIGDYTDSVSGTNLATSGTAQEFDVETTLKPSEVDLMYHGWHEHDDTKYIT